MSSHTYDYLDDKAAAGDSIRCSMSGLPGAKATTVSRFATHAGEPGVIYAANNRGLFRSGDAGRSWKAMDLPWPGPGLADGEAAVACLPE
jgi:hypothetical protein